jgi:hypothetical protein
MSIPTTEISQTTAYPSGGIGVMTQTIEAGSQQLPPYKQ